jgi:hypothetical protein
MGEKQPLTKKLPPTTTVSSWYYIAILIYRVVCIPLGGPSFQYSDGGT